MSTDTKPIALTYITIEAADKTESALYERKTTTSDWTLVTVEEGERHSTVETLKILGAGFRHTREIVHLRKGGEWMQVVPDYLMAESTPRQQIETEIADLRAEAHRVAEAAAYSGSWGSGAGILTAKADAMQHVLDVLYADED